MSALFGDISLFPQENGPDIELVVFGDELYGRHELPTGFTVVYDMLRGLYCYAVVLSGKFISSGIPASDAPPSGLRKHLQESVAVRTAQIEAREAAFERLTGPDLFEMPSTVETFGPNNGLLTGRRVSSGKVLGLTVLVNFKDLATSITPAEVELMLNQPGYNVNRNAGSVRDYFLLMSSGQLDYSNRVIGPIHLSKKRSEYLQTLMVDEVLDQIRALDIDFRDFDSRGDGIVDALNILYAGQPVYEGRLWPHNSTFNKLLANGVRTNFYQLTGLGQSSMALRIGTFCHENGHMLCRFPDMYDYGAKEREGDGSASAGIGQYCLMGSGSHNDDDRTPSPVCTYLRHLAGWCPNVVEVNTPGVYTARHGAYDTALLYRTVDSNEYFLIENRSSLGMDTTLPDNGLAVYHCDIFGSNEFQQGSTSQHYQCALLQADGLRELENNLNRGDSGDMFGPQLGVVLDDMTQPHSRMWDGSESGLILSDVRAAGDLITFRVGTPVGEAPFNLATAVAFTLSPLTALHQAKEVRAALSNPLQTWETHGDAEEPPSPDGKV